ncbi:hypothetical protein Nepgr_001329 [Nepenthes gracilis]|uniref:Uncharacterized protein n=1 Tax=Nepenthes gracilis TaxID=150966 RepID=A0AAD3P2K4_NEPGR|nr:hypothetical protein Nepgr_001329 [Nepenthes gracilis]
MRQLSSNAKGKVEPLDTLFLGPKLVRKMADTLLEFNLYLYLKKGLVLNASAISRAFVVAGIDEIVMMVTIASTNHLVASYKIQCHIHGWGYIPATSIQLSLVNGVLGYIMLYSAWLTKKSSHPRLLESSKSIARL